MDTKIILKEMIWDRALYVNDLDGEYRLYKDSIKCEMGIPFDATSPTLGELLVINDRTY